MKLKISCLFLVLSISLGYSQVSLTEAPDFTVTDIHGEEHNLYSLLDQGYYVMIDLFAHWCAPCCTVAPNLKQTYEDYGCNTGGLFVISLEADGTLEQIENFESNCGSEESQPTASGLDGGASDVVEEYDPAAYPTIILIAPDRSIEHDIWPYSTSAVDEILTNLGIDKKECGLDVDAEELMNGEINLTPNPVKASAQLEFYLLEASTIQIDIIDFNGKLIRTAFNGEKETGFHQMIIETNDLAQGTYFVTKTINGTDTQSVKMTKMD